MHTLPLKLRIVSLLIAVLLSLFSTLSAAEAFKPLTGEAGAGYLSSSGNSDTTNLQAALKLHYQATADSRWQHDLGLSAFAADTDDTKTSERYTANFKSSYNFTPSNYVFGALGFEKDRFSGVDTRYTAAVGYGRRILAGPTHILSVELGAGARYSQLPNDDSNTDAIARAFLDYQWKLTEHSRLSQTLLAEMGEENNFYVSDTGLHLDIIGGLSAKLGYVIKYNSDVPSNIEKTDRFTSVSIVYGF